MRTIETTAMVSEDGTLTVHASIDMPSGEHRVVVVIEESGAASLKDTRLDLPEFEVGGWPEGLSLRREDLSDR